MTWSSPFHILVSQISVWIKGMLKKWYVINQKIFGNSAKLWLYLYLTSKQMPSAKNLTILLIKSCFSGNLIMIKWQLNPQNYRGLQTCLPWRDNQFILQYFTCANTFARQNTPPFHLPQLLGRWSFAEYLCEKWWMLCIIVFLLRFLKFLVYPCLLMELECHL